MEKWEPLNMELRSWAIAQILRLEQTSSSALRGILRMFKPDSKTLGHQSSALSFKSKADLLFDLEEIDKTEYNHLIKLMEMRNQFAHNPEAISFTSFDSINKEINSYLLKHCPSKFAAEQDLEKKLRLIFEHLFTLTAGKLLSIEIEYTNGIRKEMRKHVNDIVVENLDSIWQKALERNKKKMEKIPGLALIINKESDLDYFYDDFRASMSEFTIEELKKMEGNLKSIFRQKETVEETLERIKEDKANDKRAETE